MAGEPDVRLEGVSHAQILAWVREGRAGRSTHVLENRMQSIINALKNSGDEVNRAVQQANAGDWDGTTAQSASTAMSTLRDFDDNMHTHGTTSRYSAMGQSGQTTVTRNRVPPLSSLDLDGQHTITSSTVDPKVRISAQRNAEDQAREVMAEYQSLTQQRISSMPKVQPVPKVVLDTGNSSSDGGQTARGSASAAAQKVGEVTARGLAC